MGDVRTIASESYPAYQADSARLDLGQERLDRLGRDLSDRYRRMKDARERASWEADIAEAFDSYHLVPPKKPVPYDGAPNLRCVLPRIGVDSYHANVMYSIFGNGFTARIVPKHVSKDFVLEADKSADFLTYVLEHEADFYSVIDDADRKAHTYGIAYLKPRYVRQFAHMTERYQETVEVAEIDPVTGAAGVREEKRWRTRKVKRTLFDGVKIDSLPVESVYVSPFVRNLEQAVEHDVVFEKYSVRVRDLKLMSKEFDEKVGSYYIPAQAKRVWMYVAGKKVVNESDLEQAMAAFDGFSLHDAVEQETIECVEAHAWEDIDDDGLPEKITVSLHPDTGTVLRVSLTPCRIVELRPRPVDERFYGEGFHKAGKPIFDEWEATHQSRMIAGQWENLPVMLYEAGGRFNGEETTFIPGHSYGVDRVDGVKFLPTPSVRSSYYQEENLLLIYFERMFGLNENMQGVASAKEISATENIQVTQRSSIRFSNPMNRILGSLNKLLEHVWELNNLCAPATKEYFTTGIGRGGRIFDKMTKDTYKSQLKFKFEVASTFDVQLLRDSWLLAFRMFYPLLQTHPAAAYDLMKNTMKNMGINLDIPKPPQADVLSPSVEHELIRKGQDVEPQVGEDYDEHLRQHLAWTSTEEFQGWPEDAKQGLYLHIDKTQILKATLEAANLNKSGMYEGGMPGMPGVTATRNPSQHFNNVRVGETTASMAENVRNGA